MENKRFPNILTEKYCTYDFPCHKCFDYCTRKKTKLNSRFFKGGER